MPGKNMLQSNKSKILLIIILHGTMFLFGFLEHIKGVSFPLIKNEFSVSYETMGIMISILSIGYTLFIITSGFMLGNFGVKKIYFLSYILCLLAVVSVFFMPSFWAVTSSLFFLFAGFGVFEISINAVATQIFLKRTALMMNLLHFTYGVGAITSPKIAGILTDPNGTALHWRNIYFLTFPLIMIILIPMTFTRFPVLKNKETENNSTPQKTRGFFSVLKTPSVWAFGITLGIMISVELSASNWGGLYFQDMYGMDPTTKGANYVSSFYIFFTLSRLLSGFLIEKIGYIRSLIGSIIISTALYLIGFSLGPAGIYVLPFQGIFLGILWPTLLAVAIGYFGQEAPLMTSGIIAISGLVNSGLQVIMGYFNTWFGAGWGYRSCILFDITLICLLFGVLRRMCNKVHQFTEPA